MLLKELVRLRYYGGGFDLEEETRGKGQDTVFQYVPEPSRLIPLCFTPIPENLSLFGILVFGPLSAFTKANVPLGTCRFSALDSVLKSPAPKRDLFSEVGINESIAILANYCLFRKR